MRRLTIFLLAAYAILSVYVIFTPFLGLRTQTFFTPLLTFLGFAFAVLHAAQRFGWGHAVLFLALTFVISLAFESVGVATGWIYGPYHYTHTLGPRFLGLAPFLIPVAWFMMMYPAYVIAESVLPARSDKIWVWQVQVAAVGGIILTAWDLAMDPMMVASGHWIWEVEGAYFGIPVQNFWGWWLTAFTTLSLFQWLGRIDPRTEEKWSGEFDRLAVASYAVTGLSAVLVDLLWGLGGPGLTGFFAMSPWVIMGWNKRIRIASG
jgi:putative membrane protein